MQPVGYRHVLGTLGSHAAGFDSSSTESGVGVGAHSSNVERAVAISTHRVGLPHHLALVELAIGPASSTSLVHPSAGASVRIAQNAVLAATELSPPSVSGDCYLLIGNPPE